MTRSNILRQALTTPVFAATILGMLNRLNFHHLYYFKVIATEGSISKASVKLLLGQPTLSMQLKQFEDQIGHPLFERKNRSLVLTEMGRVVLSYANEIFALGQEMLDVVNDRPSLSRLKLQIGALDSVPKNVINDIMTHAYSKGDVQISVFEGDAEDLLEEMQNHRIDLLVLNGPVPTDHKRGFESTLIAKLPLIIAGQPKFGKLSAQFPVSMHQQRFVLPTNQSRVRFEAEKYFREHSVQIDLIAETQDMGLTKNLVISGRGLTVTSAKAIEAELQSGSLVEIAELKGYFEEIWMVTADRKISNPIVDHLIKIYKS